MVHPVLKVLAARLATGSAPGLRLDLQRVVLVIEGGGSRAALSTGMIAAIDELGFTRCFDDVYGSSAGALNGAWLLCGRARDAMVGWSTPGVMRAVMDIRRVLRGRPVVDLDYLVNVLYTDLMPIDFAAVLASRAPLHPVATDVQDGSPVDLSPLIRDVSTLKDALRATSCLPVLAGPPINVGGRLFLDGGVAEPVPIRTALAGGATHVLVLRTRRLDEPARAPGGLAGRLTTRWLRRHAPGAQVAWKQRPGRTVQDEHLLAGAKSILQIRPPVGGPSISRIATDAALLSSAVRVGYDAAVTGLSSAVFLASNQ